ncbi:MAG: OB-fold domain-containing protein [Acidimicrobiia bacterium]|nr:OB-fold domain-containing protein [Acidimicrobiia bacterium]MCY4432249.1 OB-fold domain-containing protein [bacterium]
MSPATFGPKGTVFSSTVLRIPVPGRTPPFTLAYVDVDDGPRILAHVAGTDEVLVPGRRVALSGWNENGDPVVARSGP